jgi:hypothetical protein
MTILCDTHVHLYPCYDTGAALRALATNLRALDREAVATAFLTERSDCRYFAGLRDGSIGFPVEELAVDPLGTETVVLSQPGGGRTFLFPGRQIVSEERLEILALGIDADVTDGIPVRRVLEKVLEADGIPVVAWAPGKWFGPRGRVVESLLDNSDPGRLLLGDTSLRPTVWGEPLLMRSARARGFRVVAGSDPLPLAGEERFAGSYVSVLETALDVEAPLASIKAALIDSDVSVGRAGRRNGLLQVLHRLHQHAAARKSAC